MSLTIKWTVRNTYGQISDIYATANLAIICRFEGDFFKEMLMNEIIFVLIVTIFVEWTALLN